MTIALTTVDEFESETDLKLAQFSGHLLQKKYPGYMWGVRVLAPGMVGICLAELLHYGSENVMIVHPRDFDTQHEFELLLYKVAGELLERANLVRGESRNVAVTKRPDGFNKRFDKTQKETKIILKDGGLV